MGLKPGQSNRDWACRVTKKLPTRLVHLGSDRLSPTVNPPIERGSTLLMPDIEALYSIKPNYGRMGHTVHRELVNGLCQLESAVHAQLTPNGLSACSLAIASFVKSGDHVLVSESVYGPTRRFCTRRLRKMGVEATFFPSDIGVDIKDLIRENTALIFLEAPGSLTFDICDTPTIVAIAQDAGIKTAMDNTWGAGIAYRPLENGIDISVQALTKYVVGHADALGGAVMTKTERDAKLVVSTAADWGLSLGPDDAYLALRGLRTLETRWRAHEAGGLEVAKWLSTHPAVRRVLHPALSEHPGHALWKRDFSGANGLFGVLLEPMSPDAFNMFFETLTLYGFGFSWGGFESLLIPADPDTMRSKTHWLNTDPGHLLRAHIGLEAPEDLIADLDAAFQAAAGK